MNKVLEVLAKPCKIIGIIYNTEYKVIRQDFDSFVKSLDTDKFLINLRSLKIVNKNSDSHLYFISIATEENLRNLRGMRFTDTFTVGTDYSNYQLEAIMSRTRPYCC